MFERKETAAIVRQAIAQLPDHYRVVLMLRDIEERDTDGDGCGPRHHDDRRQGPPASRAPGAAHAARPRIPAPSRFSVGRAALDPAYFMKRDENSRARPSRDPPPPDHRARCQSCDRR